MAGYRRSKTGGGAPAKGIVSCPHLVAFTLEPRKSELLRQRPVHAGDVKEGGVKRR